MSSAPTRSKTASKKASSTSGLVPPSLLPRPKRACGEKNGQSEQATPADASVIIGICKSEVDRRILEVLLKISEDTTGVRQSILGLEARISQLETKTSDLEQQLTTAGLSSSVVGNVQTPRRDVNSMLEQQGPRDGIPEVAAENNRAAGILPELTHSQDRDMESLAHRLEALESKAAGLYEQKDRAESRRTNKSRSRKHRRSKYATSSSDDTSDSDSDEDSEVGTHAKVRSGLRKKGPCYDSLKPLRATDPLYKRFLDYRYYRLERLSQRRKSKDTGRVKDQIKRMALTLRNHPFDGEYPIQVLAFLLHFVDDSNTLDMNEAQTYIAIPYFLKGFALDQYQAVKDAYSANEGVVSCWPEALLYLLRSYVQSNAIREATLSLRDVLQNSGETEMQYSNRLNQSELRCGNVQSLEEKMTMFVNGLDPAIEPLVSRHRESHPKITYLELVHFARDEGNANRARSAQGRLPNIVVTPKKSVPRKERASAMMTHSDDDFLETRSISRAFDNSVDPLQYIDGGEDSFPTTELPTTYDTAVEDHSREEDAMFAMEQRRHVPSPRVAFAEHDATMSRRSGWMEDRRYAKPQYGGRNRADGIICHE